MIGTIKKGHTNQVICQAENQNYYYVSGSLNDVINFINKLNNVETKDKQKVLERSK